MKKFYMRKQKQNKLFTVAVYVALFILVLCLPVSCTKEDRDESVIVERVLLVYLAGDNNLSDESYEKLEAIRKGYKATPQSRILVYHNAADSVPCLLEITGNNAIETREEYVPENAAGPDVLHRIVVQARAMYPRAKFNLLVFSHASGWLPGNTLNAPKSARQTKTILDDEGRGMELAGFAAAIPDNSFEYIVFETCFMAGVEVACQLRDKADYILASSAEIVSPGFTPVYEQHISELVYGNPRKFIQEAFNHIDSQPEEHMRSATFSVIKTEGVDAIAGYVRDNCDFTRGTVINDLQYFDRNAYHLFFDFGQYYASLLGTEEQKQQLQDLIDNCVLWKASTSYFMKGYYGSFVIGQHSGLTTYVKQDRYPVLNENYTTLEWYRRIKN
jgi:hypothetical protein